MQGYWNTLTTQNDTSVYNGTNAAFVTNGGVLNKPIDKEIKGLIF